MNPSTCTVSLKKIHLLLQSLVEGHLYFIFCCNFHFLHSILSNCFCCKLGLCATKFEAECTYHISSDDV